MMSCSMAYSGVSLMVNTKNTVISPNFLVWKFRGKAQFLHNFGRIARNYAETVSLFIYTRWLLHK